MSEITVDTLRVNNSKLVGEVALFCKRELARCSLLGDNEPIPELNQAKEEAELLLLRYCQVHKCTISDKAREWLMVHVLVSMWDLL